MTTLEYIQFHQSEIYNLWTQAIDRNEQLAAAGLFMLYTAHRVAWYAVKGDYLDVIEKLRLLATDIHELKIQVVAKQKEKRK